MTDGSWVDEFWALDRLDARTTTGARAKRGKKFERVLHEMIAECGLAPRTSFRPKGEEIDGSFILDGRCLLLEAKWTAAPIPASTLYQFHGKVEGKLAGTLGVFISMGDYSADSVDALRAGKTLYLVLISGDEIRAVARRELRFEWLVREKLRAAAEQGTPYLPLASTGVETEHSPIKSARALVVQGQSDVYLLSEILMSAQESFSDVRPLVAIGRSNTGPVVDAFEARQGFKFRDVAVVADGYGDPDLVRDEIRESAPGIKEGAIFVFTSSIEAAVGLERDWWREYLWDEDRWRIANLSSVWDRAEQNSEMRKLLRRLGASRRDEI